MDIPWGHVTATPQLLRGHSVATGARLRYYALNTKTGDVAWTFKTIHYDGADHPAWNNNGGALSEDGSLLSGATRKSDRLRSRVSYHYFRKTGLAADAAAAAWMIPWA